ncbi:MAG: alkaline phosphatase [Bacteroidales bacterium]|nr:alkaline phosphatase [Bacteroidales bacterium]
MKKTVLLTLAIAAVLPLGAQVIVKGSIEGVPRQGSYHPTFKSDGAKKKPLNVILMIGDGTGLAQIASGYFANNNQLTVMNLKHLGLVTTRSATDFTTDSAASGTAYACGIKTYNYAVGVDLSKEPAPNIPEIVAAKGIVSGVVSTDALDGATPASFFAHQPNRGMANEIWADLPGSCLSFFAAGDKERMESRPDSTQKAIRDVFTVVDRLDDPRAATASRLGYLPTKVEAGYIVDGRTDFLPVSARYAMDFLKSHSARKKGFFLMVEGARIDKACHANQFESMVKEMLDFDKAIAEAIKFADEDGNTLVIISADHETGGLTIAEGNPARGEAAGNYIYTWHSAIPVPLFAYGPHAQDFIGVQGNEEVGQKIIDLLAGK